MLFRSENTAFAIPETFLAVYSMLEKKLFIRQAGVCLGEVKGKELIPSPDLALSTELNKHVEAVEPVPADQVRFLRGEPFSPADCPTGWCLVRSGNFGLGWIKNIGSRMNNYYPKEWRIRKS